MHNNTKNYFLNFCQFKKKPVAETKTKNASACVRKKNVTIGPVINDNTETLHMAKNTKRESLT